MIDQHPWITQMPMATPPLAPNSLAFVERGLEALDGTGLRRRRQAAGDRADQLLHAERGPDGARRARAPRAAAVDAPDAWTFESLLRELVDAEDYPACTGSRSGPDVSGSAGDRTADEHAEFLFGLETILDGVESLVERAGARPAPQALSAVLHRRHDRQRLHQQAETSAWRFSPRAAAISRSKAALRSFAASRPASVMEARVIRRQDFHVHVAG